MTNYSVTYLSMRDFGTHRGEVVEHRILRAKSEDTLRRRIIRDEKRVGGLRLRALSMTPIKE